MLKDTPCVRDGHDYVVEKTSGNARIYILICRKCGELKIVDIQGKKVE